MKQDSRNTNPMEKNMELEQMSSAELISLVRRQEQELAAVRAALELSHARQLELESPVAQQGGGELPQDETAAFEAWACPELGSNATDEKGFYSEPRVWTAWCAWKARGRLAQRAASVPAQAGQAAEKVKCSGCKGTGIDGIQGCTDCNGKGYDWEPVEPTPAASVQPETNKRPDFGRDGYGRLTAEWCSANNKICIGFDGKGNMTWAVYADNTSLEYGSVVVDGAATVTMQQPDIGRDAALALSLPTCQCFTEQQEQYCIRQRKCAGKATAYNATQAAPEQKGGM